MAGKLYHKTTFSVTYSDDALSPSHTEGHKANNSSKTTFWHQHDISYDRDSGPDYLQCMKMWFEPAVPVTANGEK